MMKLRDLFLEAKPTPKKKATKKPQGKLDFDSMSDKDFDAYMQNKGKDKAISPEKKAAVPSTPKKKATKKPQGKLDFDSMSDKDFDAYMQNKGKDKAPEKKAPEKKAQSSKTKKKASTSKPKDSGMPKFADLAKNASTGKEEPNYGDMSDDDFDSMIGKIGTSDNEMDNIAKKSGHHFGSDADIDMGKPSAKPEEPIDVSDEFPDLPPPLPKKIKAEPDNPVPSLASLAGSSGPPPLPKKGVQNRNDEDPKDFVRPTDDFPIFDKSESEPFQSRPFQSRPPSLSKAAAAAGLTKKKGTSTPPQSYDHDYRTAPVAGYGAMPTSTQKGGQSAFSKAMSAVGKAGNLVKKKAGAIFNNPEPSVAYATAPKTTGADNNWDKADEADADMPTLRRLGQQTNTNMSQTLDKVGKKPQPFLAAGQDPKWKVGQTVDWRGRKDFKVVTAEKGRYTLQKIENGEIKTYKFIPGGNGLLPTGTPPGSEKNFPELNQAQKHPEDNDEEEG